MKKIKNEIDEIKYLFGYKRGVIISEQKEYHNNKFKSKEFYEDYDLTNFDPFLDEDFTSTDLGVKEKERTITPGVKPGTIPGKKPGTPYSPKPGPKKAPKAKTKIPNWLTFDSIGIKNK